MSVRLCTILLSVLAVLPLAGQTSGPSDEDRKQWIEVAHKLEAAPLDEDTVHDARLAVAQIAVAHDFHVAVCAELYSDFNESKYQHHAEVRYLYLLGAALYQLEIGKTDTEGANLYALQSALKGYAAILKQEPKATDKYLDNLAKQDAKGKLPELIGKKTCKVSQGS